MRRLPPPLRKVIGDLSDTERVLVGLRVEPESPPMTAPHDATLERFEDELAALDEIDYELTLFVSGASDLVGARDRQRQAAVRRRTCTAGTTSSVVDVHEDPAAVLTSRLLATPTLVRNRPLPVRRVVGDLSDTDKVLRALGPSAGTTDADRLG